ncbi:MAG TPA: endonuclease/exonuclease/phosphatase family protein [Caulobacteraceae bacterium]|nr:endonuclease/exonuclease/phosphatase family protein [Caulobacteraceae bacterium]
MAILAALGFFIAGGSGLLALLSLGGAFSDRLDVLTHFSPFYMVGGAAGLVLGLVSRPTAGWRETVFMSAIAVLAPAAAMTPDLAAAVFAKHVAPMRQTVKIVQFNVWSENRDPARTARWIERERPDIIVMEEAMGDGALVPEAIAADYPYQTQCQPRPTCTTIILSRVAPRASGAFPSPDFDPLHSGAWARFGQGSDAFTVVGTHLTWPFPPGEQRLQAQNLADHLAGLDKSSLILAGDFNSTPWSFTLRRLDRSLGLVRRTHALFSWPARTYGYRHRLESPIPLLPIDHVYAGAEWKTVSAERGPRLGSDHFPIVVVLTR